ncbi:MAG: hypothetical protein LQ342_005743 [Letrouitia transgressa]|nr:MAG: hypothetical protein LQ342_005743 [Letrouitia transgressa]
MFASNFLSRLTKSPPLLPVSNSRPDPRSPSFSNPLLSSSSPLQPAASDTQATLLAISRQEAYLQSQIQSFLDSQSEGLVAGLGGGRAPSQQPQQQQQQFPPYSDAAPTTTPPPPPLPSSPPSSVPLGSNNHASRTTTRSSWEEQEQEYPHSPQGAPAHNPAARRPANPTATASTPTLSLRAARRGIARAMADLAALKAQTEALFAAELAARDATLAQVRAFERKKRGLEDAIAGILASSSSSSSNPSSPGSAAALKAEERALTGEIEELEGRLAGLRSRRRGVREAIERGENRVEARVSSWRGSLRECEREVGRFLERRPGWVKGREGEGEGVWGLPVKRRTLEMVREEVEGERTGLEGRKKGVEREKEALVEGGRVWEGVVGEVRGVEDLLREEMGKLEGVDSSGGGGKEGMEKVLERMAVARGRVEEGLKMAEDKGWNLLLVSIGAELEALVEGESILKGALGLELESGDAAEGRRYMDGDAHGFGNGDVELQHLGGTNGSQGTKDMEELNGIEEEGREEPYYDDEPGPELLFSKGDDEARL